MVNYRDPARISHDTEVLVKTWHVMYGIFIWDFVTTLDFEWDFILGRRHHRWTIWIYSLARITTLLAVALSMVGLDNTTRLNCQAWETIGIVFGYSSFAASSLLIVLRVLAIWNMVKIIFVITMTMWLADVSVLLYGAIRVHSRWSPEENTCLVLNFDSAKPAVIGSLVTDLLLLLILFLGLFRLRLEGGGVSRMGRVLWKQGLIWLLIATAVEVPSVVLVMLNLNAPLNIIFQVPCMVTVTIAATRMYRGLVNFGSSDISHQIQGGSGPVVSGVRVRSGPLNQMEVAVHTEYEQYGMSRISRSAGIDTQGRHKVHEVSLDGDKESGLEK